MPLSRGQRLRRLRQQKGVEIKEAAPAMGISRPYLSLLERDLKGSRLDHVRATLEKAAAYYGVIPEYLLAETPQEHIAAFVCRNEVDMPHSFGGRLRLILEELRLRWGEDEYSDDQVAAAIGATTDVLRSYLSDQVQVTETVAQQLSTLTGAPIDCLLPAPPTDPAQPYQRVIRIALDNEMPPAELEALIHVWLTAKGNKKPSGE